MADTSSALVRPAEFPKDLDIVKELITAYTNSLGIDLSFQNFEHEFASLPGKYDPSNGGASFLASRSVPVPSSDSPTSTASETIIGCACLRAFKSPDVCEVKRLYVTPDSRGTGAGKKLMDIIIEKAKEMDYKEMLLDTLETMVAARKMYRLYGFEECENYYGSPLPGTIFMRLKLQ